ncbi:hypothetical protein TrCOL_g399 [Triparma columacea]|uniref:Uncharacterized protein n=1 Tax=Triparma columacea TaxID=722753 RepID=A0A9W7GLX9_9STRA|nr:hypothetical protein TrCOL_g399 [Triparma columacea]
MTSASSSIVPPEYVQQGVDQNQLSNPPNNPLLVKESSSFDSLNAVPTTVCLPATSPTNSLRGFTPTSEGGSDKGDFLLSDQSPDPMASLPLPSSSNSSAPASNSPAGASKAKTAIPAAAPSQNSSFARGNYKCGRCGVPKKGHKCPYKPRLKRSPDETPPVTKSISIQCELGDGPLGDPNWIRSQGTAASYVDQGETKKQKMERDEEEIQFAADIAAKAKQKM